VAALVVFLLVFGLGVLAGEAEHPPAFQSALLLAGLVALVFTLPRLAQVIGVDNVGNSGTVLWMSAIFTLVAGLGSLRYRSAACALVAAIGLGTFVLAAIQKIFEPSGLTTFRWILLGLAIGFAVVALAMRGLRGALHAAQFVNAAGITLIVLGFTFARPAFTGSLGSSVTSDRPGVGWKLILVVGALAILAYALMDRARGPGYIGFFALLTAVVVVARPKVAGEGTLVGWPLIFLVLGAGLLALGLAPRGGRGAAGPGPPAPAGGEPPTFVARPDSPAPGGAGPPEPPGPGVPPPQPPPGA
jgi:hypothetical protein